MRQTTQPSKEQVRQWLKDQIGQHKPPPSPMQIREELGWKQEPHCTVQQRNLSAKS